MITPKKKLFVQEFMVDMDGEAAAIRAGYTEKSAAKKAKKLLKDKEVKALLKAEKKSKLGDGKFKKGNQAWNLRSRHGRYKLFKSPRLLWEAACEYFQWCDENPWVKSETTTKHIFQKGPDGPVAIPIVDKKEAPTQRPYTIEALCLYCDATRSWWKEFKKANHDGFLPVTDRIDEIIYANQYEGATVGAFNANIVARNLGLAEKTENSTKISMEDYLKDLD